MLFRFCFACEILLATAWATIALLVLNCLPLLPQLQRQLRVGSLQDTRSPTTLLHQGQHSQTCRSLISARYNFHALPFYHVSLIFLLIFAQLHDRLP